MVLWAARLALFAAALLAPAIGFWLRVQVTGNAEAAVDGLLWGLLGAVGALVGFAVTFRVSVLGRLGRFAAGLIGVLSIWAAGLWIASF